MAEQIMNWLNVRLHIEVGFGGHDPSQPRAGVVAVPHYSTDISAAMEILDKADGMWQLTRAVEREALDDDKPYVLRYHCQLRFGGNLGYGYADTKERAICLAALSAMKSDAR